MSVTLKGNSVKLIGKFLNIGEKAPDFLLVKSDLTEVSLQNFGDKIKVINIFPSIDTAVCATALKKFNQHFASHSDVILINISKDLPFALKRFCAAEGLNNVEVLSAFRSPFGQDYGVQLLDSGLKGLFTRAVIVINQKNTISYTQYVDEITSEPNYDAVIKTVEALA
jgi:thiol peroxidase